MSSLIPLSSIPFTPVALQQTYETIKQESETATYNAKSEFIDRVILKAIRLNRSEIASDWIRNSESLIAEMNEITRKRNRELDLMVPPIPKRNYRELLNSLRKEGGLPLALKLMRVLDRCLESQQSLARENFFLSCDGLKEKEEQQLLRYATESFSISMLASATTSYSPSLVYRCYEITKAIFNGNLPTEEVNSYVGTFISLASYTLKPYAPYGYEGNNHWEVSGKEMTEKVLDQAQEHLQNAADLILHGLDKGKLRAGKQHLQIEDASSEANFKPSRERTDFYIADQTIRAVEVDSKTCQERVDFYVCNQLDAQLPHLLARSIQAGETASKTLERLSVFTKEPREYLRSANSSGYDMLFYTTSWDQIRASLLTES